MQALRHYVSLSARKKKKKEWKKKKKTGCRAIIHHGGPNQYKIFVSSAFFLFLFVWLIICGKTPRQTPDQRKRPGGRNESAEALLAERWNRNSLSRKINSRTTLRPISIKAKAFLSTQNATDWKRTMKSWKVSTLISLLYAKGPTCSDLTKAQNVTMRKIAKRK